MIQRTINTPLLEKETPKPGILLLRLNRPDVLNALSTALCRELALALSKIPKDTRAVILTGQGHKAFCAGADLKERASLSTGKWLAQHKAFENLAKVFQSCPVPVLAAVNGVAFGGGCELVLWADLVVAADHATFAQPEVKRGIIPGMGGTQKLSRRIGPMRAKEMIFTGGVVSAEEALEWGLVNRVVPASLLMDETLSFAEAIAENAPIAVREAKAAIQRGTGLPLAKALQEELKGYRTAVKSKDREEGLKAFFEKREPNFKGR